MEANSANNGIFFVPLAQFQELMRNGRRNIEVYNLQAFTPEQIKSYFADDELRDRHMIKVQITKCGEEDQDGG